MVVTILCPIGGADQPEDMWATVFWSSAAGRFYSAGATSYFRGHVDHRRLAEILEAPSDPRRRRPPASSQVIRHGLELGRKLKLIASGKGGTEEILVRGAWKAIDLVPDAFGKPAAKPTKIVLTAVPRAAATERTRATVSRA
jgi:hypothetical protein